MNPNPTSPSPSSSCVEFHRVNFQYDSTPVLHDINFRIDFGDYVGILGPNGSGKTTVLKIMLGLLKPTSGMVKLFGEDINYFKDFSWIGYVSQWVSHSGWGFPATVQEVVRTGRIAKVGILRRFQPEDYAAVEQAMETTGIRQFANRLITQLSGGERQRVFIARALAAQPKMLILDEPTVGVDLPSQEQFYTLIRKLNEEMGMTIIFVSHDIDVITHESKNILCLNRELICHVASKDFISSEHLEKLYGRKGKYILHGH
ncbi:MAG: metal ABC transporter ATP-binding protein [Candidatus Kerfeldbacteria bacterium]|nr:metal ABC transporter ATP-binding protein [Candidatus Kerfeldbacteria bacterium]